MDNDLYDKTYMHIIILQTAVYRITYYRSMNGVIDWLLFLSFYNRFQLDEFYSYTIVYIGSD